MRDPKTFSGTFHITGDDCISAIDDSLPPLLGTYIIVKWMEIISARNINRQLDDMQMSVGKKISIEHTGMALLGEEVLVCSTIIEQKKRRVSFTLKVTCQERIIATGTHERVILPVKIMNRMMKNL